MKALCRIGIHRWQGSSANIAGHDSWRERACSVCEKQQRQRMDYGFRQPLGPWFSLPTQPLVYTACIYCLSRDHDGAACPTKAARRASSASPEGNPDA